ncbi:hypothetical protein [Polaribacter sp. IC063]|uniref:hypothetical protein n=1 Tax=Polaribacter sp. IC063 TaxID=57031 RepID=UPI0016740B4E|nr:hypothetical protein [Polaribacter sp. IC063]
MWFVVCGLWFVVGGWWLVVRFTIDDNQKTMFEKRCSMFVVRGSLVDFSLKPIAYGP